MDKLVFDPTINTGNILAALLILGGLLAFWVKIETSLTRHETKFKNIENNIREVKEELTWMRRNPYRPPPKSSLFDSHGRINQTINPPSLGPTKENTDGGKKPTQKLDAKGINPGREERIDQRTQKAPEYG